MPRRATDGDGVVAIGHGVDDRPIGIELFTVLVEVGDLHVRAALDRSGVGREVADEQAKQGRLSGAVRSDQPDAIAADDARREVADDRPAAVRLGEVARLEDDVAGAIGRLDMQAHVAGHGPPRGALLAHRHQRADAPFVAGAARLHAATQPGFLLREALVEFLRRERFAHEPRVLLLEKGRVVAWPRRQASAVELDDARREAFQKRAIVGDEDDRRRDRSRETPRATRSRRCRDGWSARRAGADPVRRRARGPAARAGASRPTTCRTARRD